MLPPFWQDKPYYSLDAYCKHTFQHKCYKIALDAHMTCPNRDGTLGTQGCIFCSAGGSGEHAVSTLHKSVDAQIREGLSLFHTKKTGSHFIAYFQAYTNTYAPLPYLEEIYTRALSHPDICGISIATRPDCIPEDVLELLSALKQSFPHKFIWLEFGLQTVHESTARFIRRGYDLACFENTMARVAARSIPVIIHVILGLPGETPEDMYTTVNYLNRFHIFGIKLQLLHVLKGTDLAKEYERNTFHTLSKEEYLDILIHCLELISPETVIHRVTGDGPKDITVAPLWSLHKRDVLNSLHRLMADRDAFQGRLYHKNQEEDLCFRIR